jgi:hypothetical protein
MSKSDTKNPPVAPEVSPEQKAIADKIAVENLNRPVHASPDNITIEAACESVRQAMGLLANAFSQDIIVPHPDGEHDVTIVVDPETGEVDTFTAKVVNRLFQMQRGMLQNVLRQLDYSIGRETAAVDELKRKQTSALTNLQRSEDPTKLRRFIEVQCDKIDTGNDRIAWAQRLRDTAAAAYLDLVGDVYTPYEKAAPRTVNIAAPAMAGDPLLARVNAQLNG